jgi:hypothetical protein
MICLLSAARTGRFDFYQSPDPTANRQTRNQDGKEHFITNWFMILRSHTDDEKRPSPSPSPIGMGEGIFRFNQPPDVFLFLTLARFP